MLDITELETDLQARIQALTGSETPEVLLSLMAALDNLTTNRIMSVQNYADLPDLIVKRLPSGSLVFVRQLNIMMMSVGLEWRGIDGRVNTSGNVVRQAYTWGLNSNGQLGDGTGSNRSSPVTVVGGITSWLNISASASHSLAITTGGVIYSWGLNSSGQLGDNTTSTRLSPVTVVGGIRNWSQVAAGSAHSTALTSDGLAYSWGSGGSGRGGIGTSTVLMPTLVLSGITNWKQVSAGVANGLGVTLTGVAYAWGLNAFGRLGDGTTTSRLSPVTVIGGITNWSQISAGGYHGLGLTSAGVAYAWGYNTGGRLGDGTTSSRLSPVTVIGGITNWSSLSAGIEQSLGLTSTGIAYAWARNADGQLGDGTVTSRLSPVSVIGGITNWSQLSSGYSHSFGITSAGIAYAWGRNNNGQLGDNTTSNRSSPVTVIGGITSWFNTAAGNHTLALRTQ